MGAVQQILAALGGQSIVQSVQHFSITLSGVTSNTATISSVTTANSFIIFGGSTFSTTSTDENRAHVGLTLTNSTTVTATRNNGTDTVVVTGCVVEFKSGVVKSNQSGTIALTSVSSNTATISSVTTGNAFVIYQGHNFSSATATPEASWARLSLTNSTTVTATRNSTTALTTTVYYTVLEFESGILNSSTQQVAPQLTTTSTSNTASLTSVTTGQTLLIWGGYERTQTAVGRQGLSPSCYLTNGTTVTISRTDSTTGTITATVTAVEFKASQVKSLQRGVNTIATSQTTKTDTVSSVTTNKAALNYTGQTCGSTSGSTPYYSGLANIALASSTSVTGTRGNADASFTMSTSYELIEFN